MICGKGFGIIRSRTEALGRFMAAYSRLARLPSPKLAPVDVREWISRVVKLETRVKLKLEEGPDVVISGDADQLEQLLINLGAQRRGCGGGEWRGREYRLVAAGFLLECVGCGRGAGNFEYGELVCAIFHDESREEPGLGWR